MFDPQERHYSVGELSAAWNMSEDTVRKLFLDEPGVMIISKPSRRKRIYRSIRIPEHVVNRVYQRITVGAAL